MTVRFRLIALALAAGVLTAAVGCGPDEIKDPKRPADAKELPTIKASGGGGGPGGGGGKPGQGSQ